MLYKNYNTADTRDLITAGGQVGGKISKVLIANSSANPAGVTLFLIDPTVSPSVSYNFIRGVVIPPGVTLVFDECLAFDYTKYSLRLTNSGTSPNLTVMIK